MKKVTTKGMLLLILLFLAGIVQFTQAQEIVLKTQLETNPAKSALFKLKINAPKGSTYNIDYGDGTEAITKKGSGYNEYMDHHFADMAKVKEHEVRIWGANFTEFMVISNQKVTEINLTDCTELINFSCANSKLKKLDLSKCEKLKKIICNANEIEKLLIPNNVTWLDFKLNRLALADFPKKNGMYTYGPMRPAYLSADKINGLTVDLTDFLKYNETTSTFQWYRYNGKGNDADPAMLIDPQTYKEENGVFTFNQSFEKEIYCVVANTELPRLNNINDHYGIMPIKLNGKPKELEQVHAAFVTDKFTTDGLPFELTLSALKDNSPCNINWGDGVIEELVLNKEAKVVKHNFIDAKVDKQHLVQIECVDIDLVKLPEVCGLIRFEACNTDSPVKRLVLDNNRIATIDLSSFKQCEEISANGCYANEIKLPATATLRKLSLNGNNITQIALSGYKKMEELSLERNKLTEIDLRQLNNLTKVNIEYNKISNLKLNGDYAKLSEMKCGHNAIPMYMLPEKKNMTVYMYAPQESYDIPEALINGYTVDLSRFNNLKGVTDNPQTTTYIWLTTDNTSTPIIKALHYDEKDGIFTFRLPETTKMYCSMQTSAFPDLASEAQNYRTKPITIKAVTNNIGNIEDNKAGIRICQLANAVTVSAKSDTTIHIYNVQGKHMASRSIKANEFVTIPLPEGIYIAKVQGMKYMKFIVS
jgi:leucine rich repeat protein